MTTMVGGGKVDDVGFQGQRVLPSRACCGDASAPNVGWRRVAQVSAEDPAVPRFGGPCVGLIGDAGAPEGVAPSGAFEC